MYPNEVEDNEKHMNRNIIDYSYSDESIDEDLI